MGLPTGGFLCLEGNVPEDAVPGTSPEQGNQQAAETAPETPPRSAEPGAGADDSQWQERLRALQGAKDREIAQRDREIRDLKARMESLESHARELSGRRVDQMDEAELRDYARRIQQGAQLYGDSRAELRRLSVTPEEAEEYFDSRLLDEQTWHQNPVAAGHMFLRAVEAVKAARKVHERYEREGRKLADDERAQRSAAQLDDAAERGALTPDTSAGARAPRLPKTLAELQALSHEEYLARREQILASLPAMTNEAPRG